MSLAAKQAFACWIVALALIVSALFIFIGPPHSPDGAGEAIGRALAHTGAAALICWYLARRAAAPWPWGRFVVIYIAVIVLLAVVTTVGRAHAEGKVAARISASAM